MAGVGDLNKIEPTQFVVGLNLRRVCYRLSMFVVFFHVRVWPRSAIYSGTLPRQDTSEVIMSMSLDTLLGSWCQQNILISSGESRKAFLG